MKLVVGITQRMTLIKEYGEKRDTLAHDWHSFFRKLKLPHIAIPNDPELAMQTIRDFGINAFILSGGDDIGIFEERDKTENYILDFAKEKNLPVIGVCRGLQFICHYLGGSLLPVSAEIHRAKRHKINFCGKIAEVNSYHNFSLNIENTPLEVLARCTEDNSIEAAKFDNFLGIMWHPERERNPSGQDLELFLTHFKEHQ